MSALSGLSSNEVRKDPAAWGKMVESAVGAHLLASSVGQEIRVRFWLENRREVDFVRKREPILLEGRGCGWRDFSPLGPPTSSEMV